MLNLTINRTSLLLSPELAKGALADVLTQVVSLRDCYPNFDQWIQDKVIPGLDSGERAILAEYRDGNLAGFAIVKDAESEKKLCCLRVMDKFQNTCGLGLRLFERAFEELQTETPLLSVAEERLPDFLRIFNYYGFKQGAQYVGLYRPEMTEYSFNGLLKEFNSTEDSTWLEINRGNSLRSRKNSQYAYPKFL